MEIQVSKSPIGRPSYYRPEFCEDLILHLSKGHTFESWSPPDLPSGERISSKAKYRWMERYPEFEQARKIGETKGRKLWEQFGFMLAAGKIPDGNVAAWIFLMKNVYGWRDRVNITLQPIDEISFVDANEPLKLDTDEN